MSNGAFFAALTVTLVACGAYESGEGTDDAVGRLEQPILKDSRHGIRFEDIANNLGNECSGTLDSEVCILPRSKTIRINLDFSGAISAADEAVWNAVLADVIDTANQAAPDGWSFGASANCSSNQACVTIAAQGTLPFPARGSVSITNHIQFVGASDLSGALEPIGGLRGTYQRFGRLQYVANHDSIERFAGEDCTTDPTSNCYRLVRHVIGLGLSAAAGNGRQANDDTSFSTDFRSPINRSLAAFSGSAFCRMTSYDLDDPDEVIIRFPPCN
jgi:hypothetical protein